MRCRFKSESWDDRGREKMCSPQRRFPSRLPAGSPPPAPCIFCRSCTLTFHSPGKKSCILDQNQHVWMNAASVLGQRVLIELKPESKKHTPSFFSHFSLRLLWVAEMWKLNKLMEKREIIRLSQKAVLFLNILSQFQARFLHVWQHHASCILCQRQLDSQWRQPCSQCKFLIIVQCLYKYTLNKSKQLT